MRKRKIKRKREKKISIVGNEIMSSATNWVLKNSFEKKSTFEVKWLRNE
jgi:hypothetical protein